MKMGKTLKKILGVSAMLTVPFTGQASMIMAATTTTVAETDDSEAWKDNVGTITLDGAITTETH